MTSLNLRTKEMYVLSVRKKTSANLFKDFRQHTRFKVYLNLVDTTGASGGGLYALSFKVVNLDTDESATFSQNELLKRLENFEVTSNWKKVSD